MCVCNKCVQCVWATYVRYMCSVCTIHVCNRYVQCVCNVYVICVQCMCAIYMCKMCVMCMCNLCGSLFISTFLLSLLWGFFLFNETLSSICLIVLSFLMRDFFFLPLSWFCFCGERPLWRGTEWAWLGQLCQWAEVMSLHHFHTLVQGVTHPGRWRVYLPCTKTCLHQEWPQSRGS